MSYIHYYFKEQELLDSDEQKYAHLKDDLHVLIEVEAPKAEAHGRLAAGIAEVQKFLVPVSCARAIHVSQKN